MNRFLLGERQPLTTLAICTVILTLSVVLPRVFKTGCQGERECFLWWREVLFRWKGLIASIGKKGAKRRPRQHFNASTIFSNSSFPQLLGLI
jgi:hypothetical protein